MTENFILPNKYRPVAMGRPWRPVPHHQWLVAHHQTLGPISVILTPSPILIHDLGVFNIYICAIWRKIAQNHAICSKSRDFAQNRYVVSVRVFPVMDLSWVTFCIQGLISKFCAPSLAILWLRSWIGVLPAEPEERVTSVQVLLHAAPPYPPSPPPHNGIELS